MVVRGWCKGVSGWMDVYVLLGGMIARDATKGEARESALVVTVGVGKGYEPSEVSAWLSYVAGRSAK